MIDHDVIDDNITQHPRTKEYFVWNKRGDDWVCRTSLLSVARVSVTIYQIELDRMQVPGEGNE